MEYRQTSHHEELIPTLMMYLEHFQLNHSPFQEAPDPAVFFPEAGRQEILTAILTDIAAGKPLVKMIGAEGSGKTLMCRLLCQGLPPSCVHVYIDNPVGSFDDLMRIACFDLGMDPATENRSSGYAGELRNLLEGLKAEQKMAVIVIDEAEKLFLATLERLIRVICDSTESAMLCIVLAGRPSLEANLEQLSLYCANVDVQGGYVLDPLDREATARYLDFRLTAAGLDRRAHKEVFTAGAVDKIFAAAAGNFRLTNILAEESLQTSCSEKSFLVLLDHVDPQGGTSARGTDHSAIQLLQQNRRPLAVVALAVVSVIVLFFLFRGGKPQPDDTVIHVPAVESASGDQAVVEAAPETVAEVDDAPLPEQQIEAQAQPPSPTLTDAIEDEVAAEEVAPPGDEAEPLSAPVLAAPEEIAERTSQEEPAAQEAEVPESQPSATIVTKPVQVIEPLDTPPPASEERFGRNGESGLPVVRADGRKRIPDQQAPPVSVAEAVPVLRPASPPPEPVAAPPPEPIIVNGRNGDQIFEERLRASAGWLGGAYRGEYTIQLMMLASDVAATNIKKMLVQDEYFSVRSDLYILRKKTLPPTIFVFYGTFKSMDAARQQRNSMPIFLRKHHPYALSIRDALHKTED